MRLRTDLSTSSLLVLLVGTTVEMTIFSHIRFFNSPVPTAPGSAVVPTAPGSPVVPTAPGSAVVPTAPGSDQKNYDFL